MAEPVATISRVLGEAPGAPSRGFVGLMSPRSARVARRRMGSSISRKRWVAVLISILAASAGIAVELVV